MSLLSRIDEFLSRFDPRLDSGLPPGSIAIDQVYKTFERPAISSKGYSTVKSSMVQRKKEETGNTRTLEVLSNVSLRLEPGSSVGIIGRNGSGKSTLLKLIAGIYQPDLGTVRVNGKISALIELGAGFHPDFTGRENVYLGGIMYGLSRSEIDERFEEIVRYAELEDFIDAPVRTYSSGMYMRLGFSLAIHTDPDILLVDEVLAVGDAGFIHRCQDSISDLRRRGKTLLLVTHDLAAVNRWCDEAVWLERGKIHLRGRPRRIIDGYLQRIEEREQAVLEAANEEQVEREEISAVRLDEACMPTEVETRRWGSGQVEIRAVRMRDVQSGEARWLFHAGDEVEIEVDYEILSPVDELVFGIGIVRADGLDVHGTNTDIDSVPAPIPSQTALENFPLRGKYQYRISKLELTENTYYLDVAIHKEDGVPFDYHHRMHQFSVRSARASTGVYTPGHTWKFVCEYEAKPSKMSPSQSKSVERAA